MNEQCQVDHETEEEKPPSANYRLENAVLHLEQNEVDIGDWICRVPANIPLGLTRYVIQAYPQVRLDGAFPTVVSKENHGTKNRTKRRQLNIDSFKTYKWLVY